jgi:exopolyphosphatase / guanosine-5'-triphosphate,3'-diphosphate pyrophosphatase
VTRVAAVDCGTNSIRLLVADVEHGEIVDLTRRMEIVRLGQGVDRTGVLAPEAIERTRVALVGYADEIARLGATRIRMVATSATRDARNATDFRDMVTSVLGTPPEVVTGEEEARLSFAGAVRGLPGARYLVVDIGGGSTEFVVGPSTVDTADVRTTAEAGGMAAGLRTTAEAARLVAVSVDIGCVRMTERYLHSDPPTGDEIAAASAHIAEQVDVALAKVGAQTTVVGLAGSVTTVAGIALDLPAYDPARIHHSRLSTVDSRRITERLLHMTKAQRLAIPVMHPGRADVIGAGALILTTILDRTGADAVTVSEHDILDGIALSLVR